MPPLVELTLPVVLFLTPAVMPVTFTEKMHEPPAMMVAPSRRTYVLAIRVIVCVPQSPVTVPPELPGH